MKQAQLLATKKPEHPIHATSGIPRGVLAEVSTAETLRQVVRVMDACRESTWDGVPMADIVQIVVSCWRSGWDIYPDQYTPQEWNAARWGQHEKLGKMLSKRFVGPK